MFHNLPEFASEMNTTPNVFDLVLESEGQMNDEDYNTIFNSFCWDPEEVSNGTAGEKNNTPTEESTALIEELLQETIPDACPSTPVLGAYDSPTLEMPSDWQLESYYPEPPVQQPQAYIPPPPLPHIPMGPPLLQQHPYCPHQHRRQQYIPHGMQYTRHVPLTPHRYFHDHRSMMVPLMPVNTGTYYGPGPQGPVPPPTPSPPSPRAYQETPPWVPVPIMRREPAKPEKNGFQFMEPQVPTGFVANPENHGRWKIGNDGKREYLNAPKVVKSRRSSPKLSPAAVNRVRAML